MVGMQALLFPMQVQEVMIIKQAERRRECSNNSGPRVLTQAERRRESSNNCVPRCQVVKQVEGARPPTWFRQPVVLVICVGLGVKEYADRMLVEGGHLVLG